MTLIKLKITWDGLPPKFVKLVKDFITRPVTKIFNKSFLTDCFPDRLKLGITHPVHKGDSARSSSNYMPISVLPLYSKLLEKLMHKSLMSYLEKINLINEHNSGFQNGTYLNKQLLNFNLASYN